MIRIVRANGREAFANDDRIINKFALSGQDGVVANIGNEFEYEIVGNNFIVKSGKAIVQGVDFEIELSESVPLQTASGSTVYWYILYAEIDMSAIESDIDADGNPIQKQGKITLQTNMYTNTYPDPPTSDNLNSQPNGKVYLPLYRFKQTSGGVREEERIFRILESDNAPDQPDGDSSYKIANTRFVQNNNPYRLIPSTRVATIHNISGNLTTIEQATGILQRGWYEIELAGAGGGGGRDNPDLSPNVYSGGSGGYIGRSRSIEECRFFVEFAVYYKLMPGGGGIGAANIGGGAGGGGGGSVLDIPQLGILFIATGGGGARQPGIISPTPYGGGGGGYGNGAASSSGNAGGAGGGGNGSGSGSGSRSGGIGGNGATASPYNGSAGGNNLNTILGGGSNGGTGTGNGANGYARLYKLG